MPADIIGVFDSGQGGLTVLKKLKEQLPAENFVFYGDSKNAPYGIKSREEVYQLAKRIIEHFVNDYNVKAVVIACNTATSAAAKRLRQEYDLPIIGIEPAVKPAVTENPDEQVAVMATELTLSQPKFNNLVDQFARPGQVIKVPAPALVEFVEAGNLAGDDVYAYLHQKLDRYVGSLGAVVLGCTHFPFLKSAISDVVGQNVKIYDGASGVSRELATELKERNLLATSNETGWIKFENSLPEAVQLSERLYSLYK